MGLLVLIAITIWGFLAAPAIVPTHFNAPGQPDNYGGKASLILLPIIGIVLFILIAVLARYPHTYNFPWPITEENAPRQYLLARTFLRWLSLILCWLFAVLQWGIIQSALSHLVPGLFIGALIVGFIFLGIAIAGYIIIAARAR